MNFREAEKLADDGKNIARKGMGPRTIIYKTKVEAKGGMIEWRCTTPLERASTWEPSNEDRNAEDWFEVPVPTGTVQGF